MHTALRGAVPAPVAASHVARRWLWAWAALAFTLLCLLAPRAGRSQGPRPAAGFSAGIAGLPVLVADTVADAEAPSHLQNLESEFQEVVRRVSPSVVTIRAKRMVLAPSNPHVDESSPQAVHVNGTGVVIADNGAILTNEHVVQSACRIDVIYFDGRSESAEVWAADVRSDLAVLRVRRSGLPAVRFCNWSGVSRGQWSIVVGNPYGLAADGQACVSVGVIANLGRRLPGLGESDDRQYQDMIQTTAAISPGNSGGPLFNSRGELVGIITAMHARAAADEGIGFAIPMSPPRLRCVAELVAGRTPQHGYLGLTARDLTSDERAGRGGDGGAWVLTIEPGGPADRAGIREGDVILRLDDEIIATATALAENADAAPIGSAAVLTIERNRRRLELPVVVAARQVTRVASLRGGAIVWRGMRVASVAEHSAADPAASSNPNLDSDGRASAGVVVLEISPSSPAQRAGLRVGDVIRRAAGHELGDVGGFRRAVRDCSGEVELTIVGRGAARIGAD